MYKEFYQRPYFGAQTGFTLPFSEQYMTFSLSAGSFFLNGVPMEGLTRVKTRYFSRLKKWGRYKRRWLAVLEHVKGINRIGNQGLILEERLRGFPNSSKERGTDLILARVELDLFTPWFFYGFKTVWFTFADMAWLSKDPEHFAPQTYYGAFGMGLRIRNENLVFSTFNLRLVYYPHVHGGSSNIGYEFSTSNPNAFQPLSFGKPIFIPYE